MRFRSQFQYDHNHSISIEIQCGFQYGHEISGMAFNIVLQFSGGISIHSFDLATANDELETPGPEPDGGLEFGVVFG